MNIKFIHAFMIYNIWLTKIPESITGDDLWQVEAYRLSLYQADLSWKDSQKAFKLRYYSVADQLFRASCSVSANIAEGYSRQSPKDKARFYEYALGSARETKDWYFKSRHIIGVDLAFQRVNELTSVIKLLKVMISDQRKRKTIS